MFEREHYNLADAAKILSCQVSDLIHRGAMGKLPIYAIVPNCKVDVYRIVESRASHVSEGNCGGWARLFDSTLLYFDKGDDSAPFVDFKYKDDKTLRAILKEPKTIKLTDLVIMAPDLENLRDMQAKAETPQEKPLTDNARGKLLAIVLGMAMDKYGYMPGAARNAATGENKGSIFDALQKYDLGVDSDTVRKYLAEASERFQPKTPAKPRKS